MSEQTRLFLLTVVMGAAIGCVYDAFRVLRVAVKHPGFLIQIEDVVYWAVVSFGMFYVLLNVNDGEVRAFSICGAILGMIVYFVTLSPLIMKVSVAITTFIKKIVLAMVTIVLAPIKVFLKIMSIPVGFVRNTAERAKKPAKKLLQNTGRYAKIRKARVSKSFNVIFKKV